MLRWWVAGERPRGEGVGRGRGGLSRDVHISKEADEGVGTVLSDPRARVISNIGTVSPNVNPRTVIVFTPTRFLALLRVPHSAVADPQVGET